MHFYTKYSAFILIALCLLCVTACKKDTICTDNCDENKNKGTDTSKTSCTEYEYPSPCMLNYYYKVGSYWVYEVEGGGTDSIYVTSSKEEEVNTGACHKPDCCRKQYQIKFERVHAPAIVEIHDGDTRGMQSIFTLTGEKIQLDSYYCEFSEIPCNTLIPTSSDYQYYDSLYVHDRYYKDVVKLKIKNTDPFLHLQHMTKREVDVLGDCYYFCKSHGIIRKDIANYDFGTSSYSYIQYKLIRSSVIR